jgi:predicted cobalt transporter CbtA
MRKLVSSFVLLFGFAVMPLLVSHEAYAGAEAKKTETAKKNPSPAKADPKGTEASADGKSKPKPKTGSSVEITRPTMGVQAPIDTATGFSPKPK